MTRLPRPGRLAIAAAQLRMGLRLLQSLLATLVSRVRLGPARWVVPMGVGSDAPVLIYFHGGSYRYGSFETHADLVSRLALAAGARVLFVEYRLAPPHRFPAGLDDAVTATRWAASTVPSTRLMLGGDSAGGALAVSTMLRLRDAGEPLPAGALLLCPWVDPTARGGSLETNAKWDWAAARALRRLGHRLCRAVE